MVDGGDNIVAAEWKTVSNIIQRVCIFFVLLPPLGSGGIVFFRLSICPVYASEGLCAFQKSVSTIFFKITWGNFIKFTILVH